MSALRGLLQVLRNTGLSDPQKSPMSGFEQRLFGALTVLQGFAQMILGQRAPGWTLKFAFWFADRTSKQVSERRSHNDGARALAGAFGLKLGEPCTYEPYADEYANALSRAIPMRLVDCWVDGWSAEIGKIRRVSDGYESEVALQHIKPVKS